MHIVHVAPEMAPFVKVGGLGDVVGSLPIAQAEAGHDVTVVLPAYRSLFERAAEAEKIGETSYVLEGRDTRGTLLALEHEGVRLLLIHHAGFFERDGIYGTDRGSFADNGERFGWFCGAALTALRQRAEPVDVILCHDWPAALVPVLLRVHGFEGDPLAKSASVLVVHNLAHQGNFPRELAGKIRVSEADARDCDLLADGRLNLLRGAIASATMLVTVSPTYARQILGPAHGRGLETSLERRAGDLVGIVNGLDVRVWDPRIDEHIVSRYDARSFAGKRACKADLQERLGFRVDDTLPLFGMVSRIDAQKGVDLVGHVAPELVRESAQIVVLGSGQRELLDPLRHLAGHWSQSVAVVERFDEALAHRIYAGADFFLMPSRFEPCGLGQLVALRYGTPPIVHRTGGLADTVQDVDDGDGTGFAFDVPDGKGLGWAASRALAMFRDDKPRLRRVRQRGMRKDVSWQKSARDYERVLDAACVRERSRIL